MEEIQDLDHLFVGKTMPIYSIKSLGIIIKDLILLGESDRPLLRYMYDAQFTVSACFSKKFLDTYVVSGNVYKLRNTLYLLTIEEDEPDDCAYVFLEAI